MIQKALFVLITHCNINLFDGKKKGKKFPTFFNIGFFYPLPYNLARLLYFVGIYVGFNSKLLGNSNLFHVRLEKGAACDLK